MLRKPHPQAPSHSTLSTVSQLWGYADAVELREDSEVSDQPAWIQWLVRGLVDGVLTLVGSGPPSDFAQEVIGARALLHGGDAYPAIAGAWITEYGLTANAGFSTHPPTAFLLALPVAWVSWPVAAQLWAWAMIGCLVITAWAFGMRWYWTLALAPLLLWPPVTWSLGQVTPVWLVGLSLAWRFRATPFAGALIALASLTKFLPAVSLVPLIRKRQWPTLLAFLATWAGAFGLLVLLNADAIPRYLQVNFGAVAGAESQVFRVDNGALLPFAFRIAGMPGVLLADALLMVVAWVAFRIDPDSPDSWALWTWLGVALLPIAWTYSLLPLVPWLIRAIRHGSPTARLLGALAFLPSFAGAAPSSVPDVVVMTLVLSGLAFTATSVRTDLRVSVRAVAAHIVGVKVTNCVRHFALDAQHVEHPEHRERVSVHVDERPATEALGQWHRQPFDWR